LKLKYDELLLTFAFDRNLRRPCVKVVEDNLKQFSFTNTGKYQVGYKFGIRTATTRELFTITPSEGEVEPGQSVTIDLHFNKAG